jgi:uncharacterized protein YkwD
MKSRLHIDSLFIAVPLFAALFSAPEAVLADESPDLGKIEREIDERINAHRKTTGQPSFRSDPKVAKIARSHSKDMAKGKVGFGHDGLNDRVAKVQKHFEIAGAAENVSKHQRKSDHAESAVSKWLKSPVHLKNIDGDYDLSGVGAARSGDGTIYITQIFVKLRAD